MSKLIIIGNGFDLAHDLRTDYKSFYDSLEDELKSDWESMLESYNTDLVNWYNFEDAIDILTYSWYMDYFDTVTSSNSAIAIKILDDKIKQINSVFSRLTDDLFNYLTFINENQITLKKSLITAFSGNPSIITFNYTSFAKQYSGEDIYHIHGSLEEGSIVLGYKLRPEHTGIVDEATNFKKSLLRENLNYRRFLHELQLSDEDVIIALKEFNKHLKCLDSNKGGYQINYSKLLDEVPLSNTDRITCFNQFANNPKTHFFPKEYELQAKKERLSQISENLNSYGELNNFSFSNIDTRIPYNTIREVIILGHSLESDPELFEDLFKMIPNIKTVTLFTYDGENEGDISKKINYLTNLTDCEIYTKQY